MKEIELFGRALTGPTNNNLFSDVNNAAMPQGFFVHPDCCTKEVLKYFQLKKANFNSTFYTDWKDIQDKSRWELFLDQIRHYSSTYGTDFQGEAWVPNQEHATDFKFSEYKVIMPITKEELVAKCVELGQSGIALSNDLVVYLTSIIEEAFREAGSEKQYELIESLTVKELAAQLYEAFGLIPVKPFDLLRYIATIQLGDAMIVQNKKTWDRIRQNPVKFDFTQLEERHLISLASVFLRYKVFLLAFKDKKNAPVLNKIRRLAKKYHKPLKPGFWENVLSNKPSLEECEKHLPETTKYKLILLVNTIMLRLRFLSTRCFFIRTGRIWAKDEVLNVDINYYTALREWLISKIKVDVKVKLPVNIRLACPTSEKNFVGNYPFGSTYTFTDNGFIGIYWRNAWGTRDFDLSTIDLSGVKTGWNASYNNSDVIYSGDMTNAEPEACEILLFKHANLAPRKVCCNRYGGMEGSRFEMIFGSQDFKTCKGSIPTRYGYMVDPTCIVSRTEHSSIDRETCLGVIQDNQFTFMDIMVGNSRVARSHSNKFLEHMLDKCKAFLFLDEVVTPVPEDYEGDDFLDLTKELNKDTLINLFK